MKISVKDKLPEYTDFVWIWRGDNAEAELCYFTQGEYGGWQSPSSVGDYEGLSVEYYNDVTHWAELEPPSEIELPAERLEVLGERSRDV
jgi:hypothetical protein